jgi:ABC-2 type transport system ATP-binding protein
MKIEVKKVTKKFKDIEVIKETNITFEEGKVYGFVGRNGSGKSVFLKMLCGFYKPTTGEILYDGVDIVKNGLFPPDTRALIENPSFLSDLTGYENLQLLASIQNKIGKDEIEETLKRVNLFEDRDKKYSKYSLGMKQKLGIAQVLMENPKVLILDEPLNGIENATAEKIRKIIKEEKQKKKIIIIASHITDDIVGLADIVYEFDDGIINIQKE